MKSMQCVIRRRAATLIELLVVISILTLLVAITVPVVQPMLEGHQIREAARNTQVFLNRARIRAAEINRPCGVRFEVYQNHQEGEPVCLVMKQIESPPPYGGLSTGAKIQLADNGPPTYTVAFPTAGEQAMFDALVGVGDRIQLNYQGPRFLITAISSGSITLDRPISIPDAVRNTSSPGLPFTVFRSPVPTTAKPVVLPRGSVIDLRYSGHGIDQNQFGSAVGDVDVVFSANGAVDYVAWNGGSTRLPDQIFLLVGEWQRTFPSAMPEDGRLNLEADGTYWVTISPRTGLTSLDQVVPLQTLHGATPPSWGERLEFSRAYAREVHDSLGGR